MANHNGLFISLEGLDGCGKTVIGGIFKDDLEALGYKVLMTREPGGSLLGQELRELLLNYSDDKPKITAEAEALLFLADRAQHVADIIIPALEKGYIVICDRYTDSTLAYQGGGRLMDIQALAILNDFATGALKPDLTIYLKTPQEVSEMRRTSSADRMEKENREFFYRVEEIYDKVAKEEPQRIITIDANRDRYIVAAEMIETAKKYIAYCNLHKK